MGVRAYYLSTLRPLPPGSVSQYRKASCIAGSVNNVGQDEILPTLGPVGFIRSTAKGRQDAPRQGPNVSNKGQRFQQGSELTIDCSPR